MQTNTLIKNKNIQIEHLGGNSIILSDTGKQIAPRRSLSFDDLNNEGDQVEGALGTQLLQSHSQPQSS